MIVDCVPLLNELDLLELRLRELGGIVDRTIVVQSVETHSGLPKPLFFDPNASRWAPWKSRLETVVLPRIDTPDRWVRERATREILVDHLTSHAPSDVVIVSDVDEIPDPRVITQILPLLTPSRWAGCLLGCYLYYLNLKTPKPWPAVAIARIDTVRSLGAQTLRDRKRRPPIGPVPGGWHFTYQGGVEGIQRKLAAFAHQEYDTPAFRDPALIRSRIERRQDFCHPRRPLVQVPLTDLPREVQRDPDRYAHLLAPESP